MSAPTYVPVFTAVFSVIAPEEITRPFLVALAMLVSAEVWMARPVSVTPLAVTLLLRSRFKPVMLAPAVKVRAVPFVDIFKPL